MSEVVARLDEWGRPAWLALMVIGFIVFWPIGLAILAYMIWSRRMSCGRADRLERWQNRFAEKWERKMGREMRGHGYGGYARPATGNRAFDEYREETLRRLEEEQREFTGFLDRLRMAKDKAEFDQFMAERRARPAQDPSPGGQPAS
jgi:hypothetical protein